MNGKTLNLIGTFILLHEVKINPAIGNRGSPADKCKHIKQALAINHVLHSRLNPIVAMRVEVGNNINPDSTLKTRIIGEDQLVPNELEENLFGGVSGMVRLFRRRPLPSSLAASTPSVKFLRA